MPRGSTLTLALCVGLTRLAQGVRVEGLTPVSLFEGELTDADFHAKSNASESTYSCCCKKKKCEENAKLGVDNKPARYVPHENLCCKSLDSCGWLFGYSHLRGDSYCSADQEHIYEFRAPAATIPQEAINVSQLTTGSTAHTVHTYCDLQTHENREDDVDGQADEEEDHSAAAVGKGRRNEIIGSLVKELSDNSLDTMAKEIFSLYVCVRYAPSNDFVKLAMNEIATAQLPNDTNALDLYLSNRFIPLRCSPNVNVYDLSKDQSATNFKTFEETIESIANFFQAEAGGAFEARLSKLRDFESEQLNQEKQAFDIQYVATQAPNHKCEYAYMQINTHSSTVRELLTDCQAAKWWFGVLKNWHSAMPFVSFMSPGEEAAKAAKKAAPTGTELALICFGKRVASQLHRRANGDHLLTDQSAVGCHGFWDLRDSAKMLHRTVMLWKPPTCQLAAMELDMKMKIMDLIADMNSRLFDALPAILMDDVDGKEAGDQDGVALQAAGAVGRAVGIMGASLGAIVSGFKSMSGTYTRLGELLGNTVVKWAVCPLKPIENETASDQLDSVLGGEDDVARFYAEQAYAKWTGKEKSLPGEMCDKLEDDLPGKRCMECKLGVMRENMPERYLDESFICPVRPLLPAKKQLELLQKKRDKCIMSMTLSQWTAKEWMYRGRSPHKKQYNSTENRPSDGYESVKILKFQSRRDELTNIKRDFVTVGRHCSEAEAAATPRWCEPPKVENAPSLLAGIAAVGEVAAGVVGAAVTAVGKVVEMTGIKEPTPPSNSAIMHNVGQRMASVGDMFERGIKSSWNSPQSSQRKKKLHERLFIEVEAGELLHSASFQKEDVNPGADSKKDKKYDRYAVTCPCVGFDPDRELHLKYTWGEHAFKLATKAQKTFPDIFKFSAFTVQLQAARVLHMTSNKHAYTEPHAHVRAYDDATTHKPEWIETGNPFLEQLVGISKSSSDSSISETKIFGLEATFACGTRLEMHNRHDTPSGAPSFGNCVKNGVDTNNRNKNNFPTVLFFPDDVVVRVTFKDIGTCYSETKDSGQAATDAAQRQWYEKDNPLWIAFSEAGKHCATPAVGDPLLPQYLKEMRKNGLTYRGMLLARGLPTETLTEVLLDPEMVLAEFKTLGM